MRWDLEGTNWQGREWKVSAGLGVLLTELDARDPIPRAADGTVASRRHDQGPPPNYNSDHHPQPKVGPGIVRAADIGEADDATGDELAHALVESRDPRIKQIIHDGMACWSVPRNGFKAWEWQPYGGANPHERHNHLSVNELADTDTRPWNLFPSEEEDTHMIPIVKTSAPGDIGHIQDLLFEAGLGPNVKTTGIYDAATAAAVKTHLFKYTKADEDAAPGSDMANGYVINANMYNGLLREWVLKVVGPTQGITQAQADARYTRKGAVVTSTGKTP